MSEIASNKYITSAELNAAEFWSYGNAQTLTDGQKQQVLENLGMTDELIHLTIQCATPVDVIGAAVYLFCEGETTSYVWQGTTLDIIVPMFSEYTLSFGNVNGYYTPDSITHVSKKNLVRNITVVYNAAQYTDLSMLDITGGTVSERETANCYVISEAGYYELPLVYGCGIVNGQTNTSAYTQVAGTYTKPFYNYLNNQITSPFIEDDTQIQASSAEAVLIDSPAYTIDGLYFADRNLCKYLRFHVSSIPALGGNATIAVKDSGGQIMWSWHIWAYPFALSTFQHTNSNNKTYSILDVNLGWVKQSSDSKFGSSPYYQWGRKDPMLRSGASASVGSFNITTCATSVGSAIQNPNTFNTYERKNYNWWMNVRTPVNFYNYWDADSVATGNTDKVVNKTVYDPCPVGFTIPCGNTFLGFSNENGGTWDSGWTWDNNFFFAAGYRGNGNGGVDSVGGDGGYWLASADSQQYAYYLIFYSSSVRPQDALYRAYGFSVRPVSRVQN